MALRDAIAHRDWTVALECALERWRGHRTIAAASLVTTIARKLPLGGLGSDDPRTAMRLAAELVDNPNAPTAAALVERIAELRYSLAIAKATSVWGELAKPLQNMLALANYARPDATDDETRAMIRIITGSEVDDLWDAVVDAPADIDRRLVLADALIELGDPRGELIALQCQPAGHDEGSRLLDERRHELLGDLALVIDGGSRFAGGLLSSIRVGTISTPPWVWEEKPDRRELCALHDISPGYVTAANYARFLAGLERMPAWVRLEAQHVRELRALGAACRFENVELSMYPPPRDLAKELVDLAAYAPTIEGFAFRATHYPPLAMCLDVAHRVREKVPNLRRFLVALLPGHGNSDDALEAAERQNVLELVHSPSPVWLANW